MTIITVSGTEIGFSSPTYVDSEGNQTEFVDSGFGAPWPLTVDGVDFINESEMSFGDPAANISISILGEEKGLYLPDNGGSLLTFRGNFKNIFQTFFNTTFIDESPIGPFEVIFTNLDTGVTYYAFNSLPGMGTSIFTNIYHDEIVVATPVMLKGDYSITFKYNIINTVVLPQTIKVIHRLRNDKVLSIRNNLPKFMNAGQRYDDYNSPDQYVIGSESNLAVMTSAFGETWNYAYNNDYTVMTENYTTAQGFLSVESTLGFDNSGYLYLNDGQTLQYTGKTPTRFTGITGSNTTIKKGTRVFEKKSMTDFEKFYRIQNLGFYYPKSNVREDAFWNAVKVVEYNERPSAVVIMNYLYELFKAINLTKTVTINGSTVSSPIDLTSWNCSHVGRICRIDNKFYFIESENIQSNGTLILDSIGCTYWEGSSSSNFSGQELQIEILPWFIEQDDSGLFSISLEKSCFVYPNGHIDKDFIDLNIFLEGNDFSGGNSRNLNIDLFVAGGVQEKIEFKRRCEDSFGTYYSQYTIPESLKITPDYEFF